LDMPKDRHGLPTSMTETSIMIRSPTFCQRSPRWGYSKMPNPMIFPSGVNARVTLVSGCEAALIRVSFLETMDLYLAYFVYASINDNDAISSGLQKEFMMTFPRRVDHSNRF